VIGVNCYIVSQPSLQEWRKIDQHSNSLSPCMKQHSPYSPFNIKICKKGF